jgi:ABC-type sugar transport system substrate-binding protein
VYEQVVRNEAAKAEVLCEVIRTEPGKQPEAIRQLADLGVSALIVVPDPGPEVASALAQARDQGVPVVLLDRPAQVEGTPLPYIRFSPPLEAARAMIQTVLEAAKAAGFPADAPAMVVVNGPYDANGRELLEVFHQALDEAKVPTLPDVLFKGFQSDAKDAFLAAYEKHPEVAIVLCVEDQAARTIAQIRTEADHDKRRFVLAAFANSRDSAKLADFNLMAALCDQNFEALARRAVLAALALSQGREPDPAKAVLKMPIHTATGPDKPGLFPKMSPPETE